MKWANFMSHFHFQIVHVEGKKTVVANTLSKRPQISRKGVVNAYSQKPQISAVTIAYQNELVVMKDRYAKDDDFAKIYDVLSDGHCQEHYAFKEGCLLMHGWLCVTKPMKAKVLVKCYALAYAGHWGIEATMKVVEHYFYRPSLR